MTLTWSAGGAPRTLLGAALTLSLLPLAACEPGVDGSPEVLADQVAQAIADGDFADIDLLDATAAEASSQREDVYAGLGGLEPAVEVTQVQQDDAADPPTAEAQLELTWDLEADAEGDEVVLMAPLQLRVVDGRWRPAWAPDLLGVDDDSTLQRREIAADRADLVDRDGEPLMTQRSVTRFGLDKAQLEAGQVEPAVQALAGAAELDPAAYLEAVRSAGPEAFVEAITYRDDDSDGDSLRAAITDIPGAAGIAAEQVLGPTRTFAQPLLGTVGEVTQEMIEEAPERWSAGDAVGRSGLEAALDDQLRGSPGVQLVSRDSAGSTTVLGEAEPVEAQPVHVSLDTRLQRLAEQTLADVEPASALVALDTVSGDVLAAANGPGSDGLSTALAGQYPPGSTFKIVSALGLLRAGYDVDSPVPCTTELMVDGYEFTNVPGYPASALGEIPLSSALANSCNTALISQRDEVPMSELATAAGDLGLGATWGMPVTAFSGSVPVEEGSDTGHAASMIGQGRVLASPAAMASLVATVSTGSLVIPRVLTEQQVPKADSALSAAEAEALRSMMRGVVTEGGAQMLEDNPGGPVIAKTGTAEFGQESPPQTHVWMIAAQDDLAVAVFVEEGFRGSDTAGPLMDAFLTDAAGSR